MATFDKQLHHYFSITVKDTQFLLNANANDLSDLTTQITHFILSIAFRVAIRKKMASSTKPEVHNVLQ